jgi:ubiquinone/menaquinone biosynthesis C-methylase UbiE
LFGCYFSALWPEVEYCGVDKDPGRIGVAKEAASRLGLRNARFYCGDASHLTLSDEFDAILIIDLLHHMDDNSKKGFLASCRRLLASDGRLIIKDVTTHPFPKLAFTWALDVLMTRGFEMWYWDEEKVYAAVGRHFDRVDTFPIADWLPYPHIVYLCENVTPSGSADI